MQMCIYKFVCTYIYIYIYIYSKIEWAEADIVVVATQIL